MHGDIFIYHNLYCSSNNNIFNNSLLRYYYHYQQPVVKSCWNSSIVFIIIAWHGKVSWVSSGFFAVSEWLIVSLLDYIIFSAKCTGQFDVHLAVAYPRYCSRVLSLLKYTLWNNSKHTAVVLSHHFIICDRLPNQYAMQLRGPMINFDKCFTCYHAVSSNPLSYRLTLLCLQLLRVDT